MKAKIISIAVAATILAGCNNTMPVASAEAASKPSKPVNSVKVPALGSFEMLNEDTLDFPYTRMFTREYGPDWVPFFVFQDFDNDGIDDVFVAGTMRYEKSDVDRNTTVTGNFCGVNEKGCKGENSHPMFYKGLGNGKYDRQDAYKLFVDNRKTPGQNMTRHILPADFNGDGVMDVYIADTGLGEGVKGYRDSYFLSQPNGTWLESSSTHITKQFVSFPHGAAMGDIDNDGDIDVLLSNQSPNGGDLECLINNGAGKLTRRVCGPMNAFYFDLADMDNDGDLDLIYSEFKNYTAETPVRTRIGYNNGKGNFNKGDIVADYRTDFFVSRHQQRVIDIDKDGDKDILVSLTGAPYVGAAMEILENTGGNKFVSRTFEISTAPEWFNTNSEVNPYNNWIRNFSVMDIDNDGDLDIVNDSIPLNKKDIETYGSVFRNNGNMNFEFIQHKKPGNPRKQFYDLKK